MRYSAERKEAVLKKMLPPNNRRIREIAEEEGISEATLYNWRKAARAEGRLLPEGDQTPECRWLPKPAHKWRRISAGSFLPKPLSAGTGDSRRVMG